MNFDNNLSQKHNSFDNIVQEKDIIEADESN